MRRLSIAGVRRKRPPLLSCAAVSRHVPRITRLLLTALTGVPIAAALGCATPWQEPRRDAIDPVRRLLHHSYPEAFQEGNPAALEASFADGAEGDALGPSLALLAGFDRVERGTAPSIGWTSGEGVGSDGEPRLGRAPGLRGLPANQRIALREGDPGAPAGGALPR